MAQKNLGQVAIINRGAYASNVSYAVLNTVTHRGGTFMCIRQCTGIEPAVNANWRTYWVPTAIGIYSTEVTNDSETVARITFTFSDGTTAQHTYNTTGIADGTVTNASLGETISVAKGGTGSTTASGARTSLGAQAQLLSFQVRLSGSANSWAITQDVNGNSLSGKVTANSLVIIGPEQTLANMQNFGNYFILLASQAAGRLNFQSKNTVPSGTSILVNVLVAN